MMEPRTQTEADLIRETERSRLRHLVAGNVQAAGPFHAPDFQLINPLGRLFSKSEYLDAIESGFLKYVRWDPESIDVRVDNNTAAIRYKSTLQVTFGGVSRPALPHWHIDLYERHKEGWHVVWSQATQII